MSRHGSFRFDGGSSSGCNFGIFRYATKLGSSLFGHTLVRQTFISHVPRMILFYISYLLKNEGEEGRPEAEGCQAQNSC